jgi:hypothetical protein
MYTPPPPINKNFEIFSYENRQWVNPWRPIHFLESVSFSIFSPPKCRYALENTFDEKKGILPIENPEFWSSFSELLWMNPWRPIDVLGRVFFRFFPLQNAVMH